MNLKNYTSDVPVSRTVARIEEALAEFGATGIMKQYEEGNLTSLSFGVTLPNGRKISIRLPADANAVFDSMMSEVRRPRSDTEKRIRDQAGRTAWKLQQDWVEVQLSLIKMQKVDFVQVFLSYVWDGKTTFYEQLKSKNFLALPEARD